MDYQIAIPSYQRAEQLRDKTLKVLDGYRVDPGRVTIFVANEAEYDLYKPVIAETRYTNLVIAEPGLHAARNFIHGYYPESSYLVSVDDDVDRGSTPLLPWAPCCGSSSGFSQIRAWDQAGEAGPRHSESESERSQVWAPPSASREEAANCAPEGTRSRHQQDRQKFESGYGVRGSHARQGWAGD
jgi:hypothetical protein